MPKDYSWTTESYFYKTGEEKPYNPQLRSNSPFGSTYISLATINMDEMLKAIKNFLLSSIHWFMSETAPLEDVSKPSNKGTPFEKREENLVLNALRGE